MLLRSQQSTIQARNPFGEKSRVLLGTGAKDKVVNIIVS
jgi:hypothetical protein